MIIALVGTSLYVGKILGSRYISNYKIKLKNTTHFSAHNKEMNFIKLMIQPCGSHFFCESFLEILHRTDDNQSQTSHNLHTLKSFKFQNHV